MKKDEKLQAFLKEHAPRACETPQLECILMEKIKEINFSHENFLQKESVKQKNKNMKLFHIFAIAAAFFIIISSWGIYEVSQPATNDDIDDYLAEVFLSPSSDFMTESEIL